MQDISDHNILVNCYTPHIDECLAPGPVQEHIRSSRNVAYCLFDFGISFQFPADTDIQKARLPSSESFKGTKIYHPSDTLLGEPYYNPFAFDVACLGNMFLYQFAVSSLQNLTPIY